MKIKCAKACKNLFILALLSIIFIPTNSWAERQSEVCVLPDQTIVVKRKCLERKGEFQLTFGDLAGLLNNYPEPIREDDSLDSNTLEENKQKTENQILMDDADIGSGST